MSRFKGPDLKMPQLKVPDFVADLFYDLRDRRLLPLIALVAVAIAAVPFLLGGDPVKVPPPLARGAAPAPGAAARSSSLTVVEATPGLRDYHKRLRRRKATNPFKQRYTEPVLKGAKLNAKSETSSGEKSSSKSTSTGGANTVVTEPSGGGGGGSGKPHLTFFAFAIDVRIVRSGGNDSEAQQAQEPIVKHRVLPQTPLPGEKAPVVTYMGPARKGSKATGKALLLVSDKVQSVFGETKCVAGEEVCQLLEVEPGFPVTFVYGDNEVHYTINVLKLELVVVGHS